MSTEFSDSFQRTLNDIRTGGMNPRAIRAYYKNARYRAYLLESKAADNKKTGIISFALAPVFLACAFGINALHNRLESDTNARRAAIAATPETLAAAQESCKKDLDYIKPLLVHAEKTLRSGQDVQIRQSEVVEYCVEKKKKEIAQSAVPWRYARDNIVEGLCFIFGLSALLAPFYYGPKSLRNARRNREKAKPFRDRASAIREARDAWRAAQASQNPGMTEQQQKVTRGFAFAGTTGTETTRTVWKYSDWPGVSHQDPRGSVQVCGIPPQPRT